MSRRQGGARRFPPALYLIVLTLDNLIMLTKVSVSSIFVPCVLALLCSCARQAPSDSADTADGSTNRSSLVELPVDEEVAVYTPRIEDFRTAYDGDLENQKIQTWEEYWSWVRTFYDGSVLLNGWVKSTDQCMAVVTIPDRRRNLAKTMNELGLIVCREWAKHKTIGAITTSDLAMWGASLRAASESDTGDGTALLHAVESVLREATQKCSKKRPLSGTDSGDMTRVGHADPGVETTKSGNRE